MVMAPSQPTHILVDDNEHTFDVNAAPDFDDDDGVGMADVFDTSDGNGNAQEREIFRRGIMADRLGNNLSAVLPNSLKNLAIFHVKLLLNFCFGYF